jgi:hypothetical protein
VRGNPNVWRIRPQQLPNDLPAFKSRKTDHRRADQIALQSLRRHEALKAEQDNTHAEYDKGDWKK